MARACAGQFFYTSGYRPLVEVTQHTVLNATVTIAAIGFQTMFGTSLRTILLS